MTTTTDPFGTPGRVPDRSDADPFGIPSDTGRATRTGDAEDRAEVPRDQWDRYLLPNEDGSKRAPNKGLTRVSTTKAALSNTFGIQKWSGRRIVQGLSMNPEAVAAAIRASAMPDGKEKEQAFGRIADGAFKTGGGKERAGLGTEFHEITEELNKGILIRENVDEKWTADLAAYEQLLIDHDIKPLSQYLERQVLCPFNNAGTFDNIFLYWNPDTDEYEMVIGDLKTGRSLDLGWLEIEIQLWLYANAYALWTTTKVIRADPKNPEKITDIEGYYEPMPLELRTDKSLIIRCPLDGTAELIEIDLSGVDKYVRAAVEAKRANAEAPKKVRVLGKVTPATFTAPEDRPVTGSMLTTALEKLKDSRTAAAYAAVVHPDALKPSEGFTNEVLETVKLTGGGYTTTPEMEAIAAKAQERRDVAAKVLGPRFGPSEDIPAPPENIRVDRPAPPEERDPVTGRKKKACGFCRFPGHTQKNCPKNPASAKYVSHPILGDGNDPQAGPDGDDPAPLSVEESAEINHLFRAGNETFTLVPDGSVSTVTFRGDVDPYCPYCTEPHACQWTSQHPDAPGHWVCTVTGKPGKLAYEAGRTTVTAEPPHYGAPVTVDFIATTKNPQLSEIESATTQAEVLQIRQRYLDLLDFAAWTPEHEEAGRLKYLSLA